MNGQQSNLHTNSLSDEEMQKKLHQNAIETLSACIYAPADEIKRLYYMVLEGFMKEARVRDFLPILVSRRFKDLCGERTVV